MKLYFVGAGPGDPDLITVKGKKLLSEADLVVALGSTLSVYPAAGIPLIAANRGVPYVIINQGATEHDDSPVVTLRLEGDVEGLFPPAVERSLAETDGQH